MPTLSSIAQPEVSVSANHFRGSIGPGSTSRLPLCRSQPSILLHKIIGTSVLRGERSILSAGLRAGCNHDRVIRRNQIRHLGTEGVRRAQKTPSASTGDSSRPATGGAGASSTTVTAVRPHFKGRKTSSCLVFVDASSELRSGCFMDCKGACFARNLCYLSPNGFES